MLGHPILNGLLTLEQQELNIKSLDFKLPDSAIVRLDEISN
jgi:hypothetical protein